jgi:hypothetical protein
MTGARTRRAALVLVAFGLLAPAAANAQTSRTWIGVIAPAGGPAVDTNPCSRTQPCATLAGALAQTSAGGEIDALPDTASLGPVTINQSVTIDLSAAKSAVIGDRGDTGIVVNAGATDDIVLRGITVVGGGSACPFGGATGIDVQNARSVSIEASQIGTQGTGVEIDPTASDPAVTLDHVAIDSICSSGVDVAPAAGHSAAVMIRKSTIAHAGTGVSASGNSHTWINYSPLSDNGTDLTTLGGGAIIDTVDAGPAGAVGAQGPAGAPGQAGVGGPAGPPAFKLVVALRSASLSGTAGRAVKVAYRSTADARTTLSVVRRGKVVAVVAGSARSGVNSLSWNGRINGRPAQSGTYKLKLAVVGVDGQRASRTARLKLR